MPGTNRSRTLSSFTQRSVGRESAGAAKPAGGASDRASVTSASGCDTTGLELPVFEYDHGNAAAVIGGVVYRGDEFPALNGAYVFGDFAQGMVWALRESQSGTWIRQKLTSGNYLITSFGFDENGEIYVTDVLGKVLKLES